MKRALKSSIYLLLYWSGVWLLARWINRKQTRILMYHGVVQQDVGVWTQLPQDRFQAQITHLARWYRPLRLSEFVDNKNDQTRWSNHAVVVTFDDGLKNNLTLAYPILAQHHVSATIYVAIALIDRSQQFGGMIWTDYVRGLIRSTAVAALDLRKFGLPVYRLTTGAEKRIVETTLAGALKGLSDDVRSTVIAEIARQLGSTVAREHAEPFDGLTWDEMRQMDRSGLIEFGAHTVHHTILTTVADEVALREMSESRERLELELGHPVRHFAYPNGTRADFAHQHMAMAERQFASAVSTVEGLVRPHDGLYDLKRINIGNDMTITEFILRCSGALDLLGL